jgi:hypothetical protein
MKNSTRVASVLAVLLTTGAAFMACGGEDKGDTPGTGTGTDNATGATGSLKLLFSPMYSAFEPSHTYKLPVIIDGVTGATFSASDPSKVDVENTATGATLTMKAPGQVTITAKLGNETGTSSLTISETTAADWERGNARYNTMVDALPTPDGGTVTIANFFTMREAKGACTTCHSETAKLLKIQHTPQQTGGYSDQELITIFTMGMKPGGARQRTALPEYFWGMGHQWTVDEADKKGLVTYLRALPPKTQGEFDYGIRRTPDGGFVDNNGNPLRPPGGGRDGGRRPGPSDAGTTGAPVVDSGATAAPTDAGAPTNTTPTDTGTPTVDTDAGV